MIPLGKWCDCFFQKLNSFFVMAGLMISLRFFVLKFLVINRSLMSQLADTFTSLIILLACLYAFWCKISYSYFASTYSFPDVNSKISCAFISFEESHMMSRNR